MEYKSKYTGKEIDDAIGKAMTALQKHQDISGKQDKITDLEAIRSNAQAGKTASDNLGNVANLNTTAKLIVDAINEVLSKVGTGGGSDSSNAGAVSVKEVNAGSGYLQTFQVLQNGAVVGTINISKELKPKVITADMLEDGVKGLLDKVTELNVTAVDTSEEVEEPDISYVTKQELDNAIASAITTTLNTEV